MIRLDKYLCDSALMTRKEASAAIRGKRVTVNGKVEIHSDFKVDVNNDNIYLSGQRLVYSEFIYIMLNKPDGYISATDDPKEKTVLELLPEEISRKNIFPAGRLDKNTLGLLLLTNDGVLAHRMLSPKHHVEKKYRFEVDHELTDQEKSRIEKGIALEDGYITKPSEISLDVGNMSGSIVLTEGKYHQIKRMFEAVGNKITYLERTNFGGLILDENLGRGDWRFLTQEEIALIRTH